MSVIEKSFQTLIKFGSSNSGLLVAFIGVAILFKNFLLALPSSVLWADQLDSKLIYWIVNWGYHILFQVKQPGMFWNANSFYPQPYSLAYSDSLLSLQLLYAPLRAIGINALAALYFSLMLTVIISCWLTQSALKRIGGFNPLEITLIVFGAHFSLSMINYLMHYQLFGFQLAPSFLLFLFLYLRDLRLKDFVIVCLLFVVGVGYAAYLAPMLFVVCLFLLIPYVAWRLFSSGMMTLLRQIGWQPFAMVGASSIFLYFVLFKPYFYVNSLYPKYSPESMTQFSAAPSSIINGFSIFSYWYKRTTFDFGFWESSYFPGYILLSLGLVALLLLVVRWFAGRLNFKPRSRLLGFFDADLSQHQGLIIYATSLLFILLFLSLGPYLVLDPSASPVAKLPYYYLAQVLPGLESVRAPGRFGMLIGLPLSLLGVFFLKSLRLKQPGYNLVLTGLILATLVESIPRIPAYNFDPDPQGIYQWVAGYIQPNDVLLELPIYKNNYDKMLEIVNNQLVGSTIDWARLLVGYGAKTSPEYELFADHSVQYQKKIAKMIEVAEKYKVQYLLVNTSKYPPRVQKQWQDLAQKCPSEKDPDQPAILLINLDSPQCNAKS